MKSVVMAFWLILPSFSSLIDIIIDSFQSNMSQVSYFDRQVFVWINFIDYVYPNELFVDG